jgi:hypothetical protein
VILANEDLQRLDRDCRTLGDNGSTCVAPECWSTVCIEGRFAPPDSEWRFETARAERAQKSESVASYHAQSRKASRCNFARRLALRVRHAISKWQKPGHFPA